MKGGRGLKRSGMVACFFAVLWAMSGCSLFYHGVFDGESGFYLCYSDLHKDCFVGEYAWDGTEDGKTIFLPETYKNYPVTKLGGYFGRGVPMPFHVELPLHADYVTDVEPEDAPDWYPNGYEVVDMTFTLVVGENLREVYYTNNPYFAQENSDGSYTLYRVSFSVTCSPQNPVFYSDEGRLYNRFDGSPVDGLRYVD